MDPLTHTLTGLALSRAGLRRFSSHATAVLLLAANAPDIDIVTAPGGAATYLHYHRHITHALISIPVMALLAVLVVRLFSRQPFDRRRAYLAALIGAASHPLLDFTNAYGVRLLLPFSGRWLGLDLFNVVDLWIWAVLLLAALAPVLSRLVSSEIGAKPAAGRGWAVFALCFLACYGFGRWVLHERALAVLNSRLYDEQTPLRVGAFPGAANPFRWTGLVETSAFYDLFDLNLLAEFDPAAGRVLYKTQPGSSEAAAADAARQTAAFRAFLDFSQYPLWRFTPVAEGLRVDAMDLRFGTPDHPRFVATALVSPEGRLLRSAFSYQPPQR